jgi:hypothetical protein
MGGMKVKLNGDFFCELESPITSDQLNWMEKALNDRQLVLTGVKLNGEEVLAGELSDLAGRSGIDFMDITAATPHQLVGEALAEAGTYLPRLAEGLRLAAGYFLSGREGEGISLYLQAVDGLIWFQYMAEGLFNFGQFAVLPSGLAGKLGDYRARLGELLTAWENQDYLLIGDLLDYEIAPFIEYFVDSLDSIRTAFLGSGEDGVAMGEEPGCFTGER